MNAQKQFIHKLTEWHSHKIYNNTTDLKVRLTLTAGFTRWVNEKIKIINNSVNEWMTDWFSEWVEKKCVGCRWIEINGWISKYIDRLINWVIGWRIKWASKRQMTSRWRDRETDTTLTKWWLFLSPQKSSHYHYFLPDLPVFCTSIITPTPVHIFHIYFISFLDCFWFIFIIATSISYSYHVTCLLSCFAYILGHSYQRTETFHVFN